MAYLGSTKIVSTTHLSFFVVQNASLSYLIICQISHSIKNSPRPDFAFAPPPSRCSLGTAYRASLVGLLLVSSNKL